MTFEIIAIRIAKVISDHEIHPDFRSNSPKANCFGNAKINKNRLGHPRVAGPLLAAILSVVWAAGALAESSPPDSSADINAQIAELTKGKATLEDVIRILGEPIEYVWGEETFTKEKLPKIYIAHYEKNLDVVIEAGKIDEIRLQPGPDEYRFEGKLSIGSSLEDVLAVLGQPSRTVTGGELTFQDKVLYKDCPRNGRTVSYYARSDRGVRLWIQDDTVSAIYLTVRRIGDAGRTSGTRRAGAADKSASDQTPSSVKKYDDVRSKDLSQLDLRSSSTLLATLTFNEATIWPDSSRLAAGGDPRKILADAKNPGLGVRRLHQRGITGKGVSVAIIDQPMYQDHPEFAEKIAAYHDLSGSTESSMHGPAVASLLVGSDCGTAPEAALYYVAAPDGTQDSAFYARALDWIVEQNANLPASQKIRVVSVSARPSGPGSPFTQNTEMWDAACQRAEKAGILVLDCTEHHGFIGPCWYDSKDPENVSKCTPGFPGRTSSADPDRLLVPTSPRTTAEERDQGKCEYIYWGRGGLSWAIPYCAGVLAMGWQLRPDLPPETMRELLFKSAYVKDRKTKIIHPQNFILILQRR